MSTAHIPARFSRRSMLRGLAASAVILAAAAASPAAQAFAAREKDPGELGVEQLGDWAAGKLVKRSVPLRWSVYAPPRGAAFYYPPNWTVTEIADPNIYDLQDGNPFGTWAVAPDQSAAVLLLNVVSTAPITARDAAWSQIEAVTGQTRLDELADDALDWIVPNLDAAFVAASAGSGTGETICAVIALTTPDTVLGGSYIYCQLVIARTEAFDEATDQVFLPMLMNLITDGGSACDTDPDDDDDPRDDCPSSDDEASAFVASAKPAGDPAGFATLR